MEKPKLKRGGPKKNVYLLIDALIDYARVNSGFIHLKTVMPIMRARGFFRVTNPTVKQEGDQMGCVIRMLVKSGKFEYLKHEDGYPWGTYKLKEHNQFK